jgi:transglutaminase-like putative cysteine protease
MVANVAVPGMDAYLQVSEVIDWHHPDIQALAAVLAAEQATITAIARHCFEWVRDRIRHSFDYQLNPVTWRASDVLRHRTGYCYAKSHLLVALLRANGIPAGFCYQRLSVNDEGAPYCLHGLNGVYLPDTGWYRIDPRGNRARVDAQFTPPEERLAFSPQGQEEADFTNILPAPLPAVLIALQTHATWDALLHNLPDMPPEMASQWGLTVTEQRVMLYTS